MGKGTNATHINEGLYTVDYQYDTDAITARITTLTTRLGELNLEKGTITSDISTKESDITSKEDTIDQNIDDLNDLKSELSDLNSDLDEANERLDEIPDEITEQEDLLAPIEARMLIIVIFLSPIQASIASKQAELAEATDPAVIAQLTSEIEALQEQETILSDEYDDLNEQKTSITTAISDLQTEQSTLQGTVSTLEGQITSKETEITTLRDTKHSNENDLSDYRADLLELEAKLASIKLQIASTQKSIDALTGIPTSVPGTYAWCADLTEDLSGEVGIMEVAGFEDSGINIQPGYEGNAVYDEDRDGIVVPAEATSGAQSFWNKAMQGGWQKWRPTFRWGTITVIDYELDTCSVTMSTETNPDTGLDVNKMATLSDVPIEYMSCNSAPFVVGDTVVVKFTGQSWDDPVVIGFTSEPKACGGFLVVTSGTYCFVWSTSHNALATNVELNTPPSPDQPFVTAWPCLTAEISTWIAGLQVWPGWMALFNNLSLGTDSVVDGSTSESTSSEGGEGTGYWTITSVTNTINIVTTVYTGIKLSAKNESGAIIDLSFSYVKTETGSHTSYRYCAPESVNHSISFTKSDTESLTGQFNGSTYISGPSVSGSKTCRGNYSSNTEYTDCTSHPEVPVVCTGTLVEFTSFQVANSSFYNITDSAMVMLITSKVGPAAVDAYGAIGLNLEDIDIYSPVSLTEQSELSSALISLITSSGTQAINTQFFKF